MPIETAQYINTLQPDWPQGVDPEADGDDHIRMVKKVLQNTFPALDSPVNGTPTQLNDLVAHVGYVAGDGTAGNAERIEIHNVDWTGTILATIGTASKDQLNSNAALAINWAVIQQMIYPVGSVLMNSTGVNPADYLGFGTWTQRSGVIYGAGSNIADQFGALKSISPGAHNSDASWRVQNSQITAADLSVSLTMDAVADHSHGVPVTHIETSSQTYGSISNGSYDGVGGYPQTQGAGGHTPTGTGSTTIGTGAATEGNQFMNPGWAFTVWERTA